MKRNKIIAAGLASVLCLSSLFSFGPVDEKNITSNVVSAASVDISWRNYTIYLSHNEAQAVGMIYSKFPGLPFGVKQIVHYNAKKIKSTDKGRGVKVEFTRWPCSLNAFLTGIYAR